MALFRFPRLLPLAILSTVAVATACANSGVGPSPDASPSGAGPAATASPPVSATPTALPSPAATATTQPSPALTGFREDFDAPTLDPDRWLSFPGTGVLRVINGKLEAFTSAKQSQFPYLVTKNDVVPPTGPWFWEVSFKVLELGTRVPAFALDFIPPVNPDDDGVSVPFVRVTGNANFLSISFKLESSEPIAAIARGYAINQQHRVRIEADGIDKHRILYDGFDYGTVKSNRRPKKFYIGPYPMRPTAGGDWARFEIDYVQIDVLTTPEVAKPSPGTAAADSPTPANP